VTWTEKFEIERGDMGENEGKFDCLVWKDRQEVYVLMNINPPPGEGSFCDDSSHPVKPHTVEQYKLAYGIRRHF
jgi:hypothetical protein